MPKPEFYIIFTGNKGRKPDKISLSKEFFEGADVDIEVKAKVIYESDKDDIINQYILFCKVFNEQTKQHGMTQKAVMETIRICNYRNQLYQSKSNIVTALEHIETEIYMLYFFAIKEEQWATTFRLPPQGREHPVYNKKMFFRHE